jgi:hypothetical protein
MSYRDFTLPKAKRDFGLNLDASQDLFSGAKSVSLSSVLQETLTRQSPLALISSGEKGRSEWIIAPFLAELWVECGKQISVFSGPTFDVDPDAGLNGVCDFLVCRSPQLLFITAPVLIVAEAKRDNPAEGYGQCIAGMVAAQRYNESEKNPIDAIYGVSTSGNLWKFLCLRGKTLWIDLPEYTLPQADRILGILMHMVGPIPQPAVAA